MSGKEKLIHWRVLPIENVLQNNTYFSILITEYLVTYYVEEKEVSLHGTYAKLII